MIRAIDYFLDRITMYRLVLYYLIAVLVVAIGLGSFHLIPYSPLSILLSTGVLLAVSLITNVIFSHVYEAPTNGESTYITALILACLVTPLRNHHDLPMLGWAALLAIASKYILAIRNKHIFNPAAVALVLTGLWLGFSASWWVGTPYLAPVVIVGGLLMVRKIRRADMLYAFFLTVLILSSIFAIAQGQDLLNTIHTTFFRSSLLFLGFVMLTEPLTAPVKTKNQILYAILVGILFVPQVHIGSVYFTPELALCMGNVFAYFISPKIKERLVLQQVNHAAPDVLHLSFQPSHAFTYQPGQYMEFTLPHVHADSRGNRRYLTLASSPTEGLVQLGVKLYPKPSTFKQTLSSLVPGNTLMGGQLAGEFTMPKDPSKKLVFVAGGIGITPYRSMIKFLLDTNQRRDITLLYMNKNAEEIAYTDIFNEAAAKLGIKTVYTLTDTVPTGWAGRTGRVDAAMIQQEVPDYKERIFYISGPHPMVVAIEAALNTLGVPHSQIKKDFFPGLA